MLGVHSNRRGRPPVGRLDLQLRPGTCRAPILRTTVATLVVAGGLFAGFAPSAVAADTQLAFSTASTNTGFQFSAEPYSTRTAQQRSDFAYELQPGYQILDQFVVKNSSAADESFLVYGEDATNLPRTGAYAFQQRSQMHNTGVGLWLTAGTPILSVPSGREVVATFQLSIPANASPGDHVGGVVVEEVKSPAQQTRPVGVNVVLRQVIPMYVHVVGPSFPALTIENLTVFHQSPTFPYLSGSKVAVRFDLVNTGNVIVDPRSATVSITGELSGTLHKYTVHQTGAAQSRANPLPVQMLPGARLTLTEEWSGITPFDPLTGHVSVDAVEPGTSHDFSTTASTAFWYFPWVVALIGLVIIAGVIALIVMRRRRRAAPGGKRRGPGGPPDSGGRPGGPSTSTGRTLEEAGI